MDLIHGGLNTRIISSLPLRYLTKRPHLMSKHTKTSIKKSEKALVISVGGNEQCEEKPLKGYAMPLHVYLRKKYGPNCGFDPMTNVFNMLEQHIIGNWSVEEGMQLSRIFMAKQTGLTVYQLDKALKELSKRGLIHIQQVCRIKPDGKKIWEESIYRLHPDKYGIDILWLDEAKPRERMQYIPGGKLVHKNVIPLVKKQGGGSMKNPVNSKEGSMKNPGILNDPSLKNQPIINEGSMKNPGILNDQKTGLQPPEPIVAMDKSIKDSLRFSQDGSMRELEIDKKDWSQVRAYLLEIHPGDAKELDTIYRELRDKGVDDLGQGIHCLPALMLASYPSLKKARENPYTKPPRPEVVEESIDEVALARAREEAMSQYKKAWVTG